MIGSPRDTCLFEFFAVLFVGRIDDQRSFGGLDQYEIRFFAFDDFFPVDILLVPRDIQSPDFEKTASDLEIWGLVPRDIQSPDF